MLNQSVFPKGMFGIIVNFVEGTNFHTQV